MKPRLLDLFCGAGGAAAGYARAGFDVVGVDIRPQKNYPFPFIQADAMTFTIEGFDVVHASPPCQRYSSATPAHRREDWPDMIPELRERLRSWPVAYVIENVPQAPLEGITLCGVMFGLPIARHRVFESNRRLVAPGHVTHPDNIVQITGGGPCNMPTRPGIGGPRRKPTADGARRIMEMPWATKAELNEAIPPAYTAWIGRQIITMFLDIRERITA